MRGAIYARYSTDRQDRKTSIAAQVENCRALADKEGFTLAESHVFKDEALSGAKIDRPGYAALKRAVLAKEVDVVLADETSRLTRVTSELVALGELLQQQRPRMHLVTCDGIDTRSDGWEWLLLIKAGVDSQERRKIATRTYSRLRERHRAGKSAGGKPYGYTHESDGDYKVKVVVPDEARVARRIFKMYADGMSHRDIACALNDEGLPSPGATWKRPDKRRDGKWMGSGVYAMLRNPIYRGEVIWNRAESYMYTDPDTGKTTRKRTTRPQEQWMRRRDESLRIVSEKLWQRCEARMRETKERNAKQKYRGGRRQQRVFDLVCDECGGKLVMVNGRQLACASHRDGGDAACTNKVRLKLADVNRVLVEALCDAENGLLSDATLREVRQHMVKHVQRMKREAVQQSDGAAQTRQRIADLDGKIENVLDLAEQHGRTDAVAKRLEKLEAEKRKLEDKLAASRDGELDKLPDTVPGALKLYRDQIAKLATKAHGLTVQQLFKARALINEVMEPPRVGPDGMATLRASVAFCGAQERT